MTKEEILNRTGLNWNVKTENVMTASGIEIPNRIALVREDIQEVLGIHTNVYVPYQNDELIELLFKISNQSGLNIHTGGFFKNGKKVWFQLKSDDYRIGNDMIKGYISGFNSFDGRSSLTFGNATLTVSCMNTFWNGYDQVETRLRHSAKMRPRIDEILRKIDVLLQKEKKVFETIRRMNEIPMTPEIRELITKMMFSLNNEEKLDSMDLSTNKQNKLIRFNSVVDMELAGKDHSIWGLFSGVTRYTTHEMKRGDNSESKIFGRTGAIERKIYNNLALMTV